MNDRPAPGLADRLRAIVGERGLVDGDREKAPFETDWRGQYHGRAAAVVKPSSADEVARVVAFLCSPEAGIANGSNLVVTGR